MLPYWGIYAQHICPDRGSVSIDSNYRVSNNGESPPPSLPSGVMFPLSVHKSLPVSTLYVTSLSVRGGLGNVSVYLSRQGPGEIDPTPDEERWEVRWPMAMAMAMAKA